LCASTSAHLLSEALLKTDTRAVDLSQTKVCFVQTPQHDREDEKVAAIHENTTPYHRQRIADIVATQPTSETTQTF